MVSWLSRPRFHWRRMECNEEADWQNTKKTNTLWSSVSDTWYAIPRKSIIKLNDSIPDRVNAVFKESGGPTQNLCFVDKYYIREIKLTRCVTFKLFTDCWTIKTASNGLLLSEKLSCICWNMSCWKSNLIFSKHLTSIITQPNRNRFKMFCYILERCA